MNEISLDSSFSSRIERISDEVLSACYQCGTCTASCPMSVPVRKILRNAQLGINTVVEEATLWNCATCKLCEARCPRGVNITNVIHALRVLAFENRKAPAKLEKALWDVYENSSSWGGSKKDRAKWANGLNIEYNESKHPKNLLYVGCLASFDPRLQRIAKSLVQVLNKAGVDFAILGEKEACCGDVVYHVGEEGFLEELIQSNLDSFKRTGAENIIAISPHCYNMFKSVYPKFGNSPNAFHYTEIISDILDKNKLHLKNNNDVGNSKKLQVTYHDPCYLGRYHGIYEEPRKIIESIPGTTFVEMDDNKQNASCCGGGGGLMWSEFIGDRPSHQRVKQAAESGSSLMVTSCPYCIQNFEDAVKTEGISNLGIADISEVVVGSMNSENRN